MAEESQTNTTTTATTTTTTDDTNSEFRDSIVTYSTNGGESSLESESDTTRDSQTTDSSHLDHFNNNGDTQTPRISRISRGSRGSNKYRDDDDDDEDDIDKSKRTGPLFYQRKRFWVICAVTTIILLAILLPILLLVAFPAIASKTMSQSTININSLLIEDPQESGFNMDLDSNITNGGPYEVQVTFPDPITIYYKGEPLGTTSLDGVNVKNGNGQLSVKDKAFVIADPAKLVSFTADLLLSESVDWELKGNAKVELKALHLSSKIKLDKVVTINGANKFQDTVVNSLVISQNRTTNTLDLVATATLQNPSPLGIELGALALEIYYNSTLVAPVITDDFTLLPGANTLTMRGTVAVPQTDNDKSNVEGFVTSYIRGENGTALAKGVSSTPKSGTPISWLNAMVKGLQLDAKLASTQPFKVITGVDFGQLQMTFTSDNAYAPIASSVGSIASYQLPFDIDLQVTETEQNITLYTQDQLKIATLTTGYGSAKNDATQINMNIPASPLVAADQQIFQDFVKNLTLGSSLTLEIIGTSDVVANTVIGNLTLTGIPLNTTTTLTGLQGLNVKPPVISNMTLIGGTNDGLLMGLNVDLFNPTNNSLNAGSVNLEMFYLNQTFGFAQIANLSLVPADSILSVVATVDPKNNPIAADILNFFLNGTQVTVDIGGYANSTTISSLSSALTALKISSTLPPLATKILGKASLQILPDTGKTGVAKTSVDLVNPFAADLSISSIQSTLGFRGKEMATIDISQLPTPIVLAGNKTTTVAGLPVTLNLDPTFLFDVMRISAKAAGLDLTPIDVLLTLGGITGIEDFVPIDVKSVDPSIFKNFNIVDYAKTALSAMTVDVNMKSTVTVGTYTFEMPYTQFNVSTSFDDSISFLVTALSEPIVQKIVDGSNIGFSKIFIQNPTETAFDAAISGEIDDSAPFDATISFPNGASISSSDNTEIGKMVMPDITATDGKAILNLQSPFQITNTQALSAFTGQILTSKSASWIMSSNNLTIAALGISVPNVNLSKTVDLAGANGFANDIQVIDFSIPGGTPQGGIAVKVDVNLKNEAVIGVDLGTVNFNMFFNGTFLGPIGATGATFLPSTTIPLTLNGQILPTTDPKTAAAIAQMFELFLAGETVIFDNVGDSVVTKNGPVSWLNDAIKKISVEIPIQGPKVTDESVISLDAATITGITADSFNVQMVGSISKTGPFPATLSYPNGVDVLYNGNLIGNTKMSPISVQPNTTIPINDNSLFVVKDIKGLAVFTGDLLKSASVAWELKTDTMDTEIGKISIPGIPFDKKIDLIGFNGLNDGIKINNVYYGKGGDGKGLPLTIDTTLTNPSNVGIELGTVIFDTFIEDTPLSPITAENVLLASKSKNSITFTGEITDFSVIEKILTIISSGQTPLMKVVGKTVEPPKAGGSPVPWLQVPFSQLKIELPFTLASAPGSTQALSANPIKLGSTTINFDAKSFTTDKSSTVTASITNTFPSDIIVHGIEATVSLGGDNLGTISVPDLPTPPTLKAGETTDVTMPFSFGAEADLVKMQKLATQPADSLAFDISLTSKISIGTYLTDINYTQSAVPLKIAGMSDLYKSPSNTTASNNATSTSTPSAKGNTKGLPPKGNTKGLPPKGNTKGLPPKGNTKGLPPKGNTKGLPPKGNTKGLPPKGNTKGLPPKGNTKGLPPKGNTKGLPPKGNTKGLPPVEGNTKGLPPKGNTKGLPPVEGNTKGLPPKGNTKGLPPKGNTKGLPPKGNTKGLPPKGNTKGLPPKGNTKGLPPKGNTKGLPPKGNTKGLPPPAKR